MANQNHTSGLTEGFPLAFNTTDAHTKFGCFHTRSSLLRGREWVPSDPPPRRRRAASTDPLGSLLCAPPPEGPEVVLIVPPTGLTLPARIGSSVERSVAPACPNHARRAEAHAVRWTSTRSAWFLPSPIGALRGAENNTQAPQNRSIGPPCWFCRHWLPPVAHHGAHRGMAARSSRRVGSPRDGKRQPTGGLDHVPSHSIKEVAGARCRQGVM